MIILDEKWLLEQTAAEHFVAAINEVNQIVYKLKETGPIGNI